MGSAETGWYGQIAGIFGYAGVNFSKEGVNGLAIGVGVQGSAGPAGYAQVGGIVSFDYDLSDTNLNPFSENFDLPMLDVVGTWNEGFGVAVPTGTPVPFNAGIYDSPINGDVTLTGGVGWTDFVETGIYVTAPIGWAFNEETRSWRRAWEQPTHAFDALEHLHDLREDGADRTAADTKRAFDALEHLHDLREDRAERAVNDTKRAFDALQHLHDLREDRAERADAGDANQAAAAAAKGSKYRGQSYPAIYSEAKRRCQGKGAALASNGRHIDGRAIKRIGPNRRLVV